MAGTVTGFPVDEEQALVTTERVASGISLIGCFFVMFTFLWSKRFRKPVNRLIFYATWGNLLLNIGTLISVNGMRVGFDSPLCQLQAFLIQMFLPADAFWNLAMAINTYLTVFRRYNAAQCKAMEKWYFLVNFGFFGLVAIIYCAITNSHGVKPYGGAVLWCWIRSDWDKFRIYTCYMPAWIAIVVSFTIYVASGRRLFQQEKALAMLGESPSGSFIENPFTSYKTTEIHITSEAATPADFTTSGSGNTQFEMHSKALERQYLGSKTQYEEYSVTIERRDGPVDQAHQRNMNEDEIQLRNSALQANKVAKSYAMCCILFFVSLLITWIPSSIFRVYLLTSPIKINFGMAYSTGFVLPLMGFWNALIYITISWDAVRDLFAGNIDRRVWRSWHGHLPGHERRNRFDKNSRESWNSRSRGMSLHSKEDFSETCLSPSRTMA